MPDPTVADVMTRTGTARARPSPECEDAGLRRVEVAVRSREASEEWISSAQRRPTVRQTRPGRSHPAGQIAFARLSVAGYATLVSTPGPAQTVRRTPVRVAPRRDRPPGVATRARRARRARSAHEPPRAGAMAAHASARAAAGSARHRKVRTLRSLRLARDRAHGHAHRVPGASDDRGNDV